MQYLRTRYYNLSIARFEQKDAWRGLLTENNSLNRYDYCYNDPVRYHDDGGHIPLEGVYGRGSYTTTTSSHESMVDEMLREKRERQSEAARAEKNSSTASNNSNLVENPYPYGPDMISQEVYECLRMIEESHSIDDKYDIMTVLLDDNIALDILDNLTAILNNYDEFLGIVYDGLNYYSENTGIDSDGRRAQIMQSSYYFLAKDLEDLKDIYGNINIKCTNAATETVAQMIMDELTNASITPHALLNYTSTNSNSEITEVLIDGGIFLINALENPISEEAAQKILDEYKADYNSGVYYEDISASGGYGLGAEKGVMFVVNVDEGYVSQLTYIGGGFTTPGIDYSVQTGQVYDLDDITELEDGAIHYDLSVFLNHSVSSSISWQGYGNVSQRGNGVQTSTGASLYFSYSYIVVTHEVND